MTPACPSRMLLFMAAVVREAGAAIMQVYRTDFDVQYKEDESPVTEADLASHRILQQRLGEPSPEAPRAPLLSEESDHPDYAERTGWKEYWLADPMDGTKDFVQRDGDFTICLALMRDKEPVLGAVYAPVHQAVWIGGPGEGAFRCPDGGKPQPIRAARHWPAAGPVVLQSRVRHTPKLDVYLQQPPVSGHVSGRVKAGSAYKFCLLAQGDGHLYPCLHPTWEWDTAAGQALLQGAGARITQLDGRPLEYNKPNLLNPEFVAWAGKKQLHRLYDIYRRQRRQHADERR